MAKKKPEAYSASQILLGERLHQLREYKNVSRRALGRAVKVTEQQIAKYEAGAFIPMATLEKLAEALDEPIQKKLIRKISALRKREKENGVAEEAMSDLYKEAFADELE